VVGFGLCWKRYSNQLSKKRRIKNPFHYVFPNHIYLTASAFVDYQIYLITFVFINYLHRVIPLGPNQLCLNLSQGLTSMHFLWGIKFHTSQHLLPTFFLTFLAVLSTDLAFTVYHIAAHKVPFLWKFHRIHHSATSPNILASARLHPFESFLDWNFRVLFLNLCLGVESYFFDIVPMKLFFIIMIARDVFNHFRHSHIWLSFGKLDYFFSSPALHQIHHSSDPKHFNKNFSSFFSFLDWIFGTLYVPHSQETITWGLGTQTVDQKNYTTALTCLIEPLVPARLIRSSSPSNLKTNAATKRVQR
jgi:sterol desaturase/sphingolipid hydroxylase (fatty acid hydroxylase superfamily)